MDKVRPEAEEKAAEAEFQRVLGNLAAMPPKPHEKSTPVPGRKRGRPPRLGGNQ